MVFLSVHSTVPLLIDQWTVCGLYDTNGACGPEGECFAQASGYPGCRYVLVKVSQSESSPTIHALACVEYACEIRFLSSSNLLCVHPAF